MILDANNLTKRWGHTHALSGITFGVERGQLLGIVGPDGAGKTTLLRLLAGVLTPSAGHVRSELGRRQVGYLSQHFSLYPDLTVWENVSFFAGVYGLHEQAVKRRGRYLLEWVGLWDVKDRLAAQLSGGMKQKLSLACALVHQADLLLLDEPTTAVDPVSRREFWDLIMELVNGGTAVIVSTPYMEEAARCHRVGLLHRGRLLAFDTPDGLRGRLPHKVLEVRAPGASRPVLEEAAMKLPGAVAAHAFGDTVHVTVRQMPSRVEEPGLPGLTVRPVSPSLEDVYIWMLSGQEAGA